MADDPIVDANRHLRAIAGMGLRYVPSGNLHPWSHIEDRTGMPRPHYSDEMRRGVARFVSNPMLSNTFQAMHPAPMPSILENDINALVSRMPTNNIERPINTNAELPINFDELAATLKAVRGQ